MSRPRYYVEVLEPELAKELEETRVAYTVKTGRPGFQFTGSMFTDEDEAVEFAKSRHAEGLEVRLMIRYLIEEE